MNSRVRKIRSGKDLAIKVGSSGGHRVTWMAFTGVGQGQVQICAGALLFN